MPRFDIARLRKEKGLSQNELANILQMNQSFLSAIENGRSPLPIDKEEKLCEAFGLKNLNDYYIPKNEANGASQMETLTDSDLFNQLLSRFHKQAHSMENEHHHHDHHEMIDDLQRKLESMFQRNESLTQRCDRLMEENDRLRTEIDSHRKTIDSLREEIFRMKLSK